MNLYRNFLGLSFIIMSSFLAYIVFSEGLYILAPVFLALIFLTGWIWLKKENLVYRFLFPGMVFFFLLTILPIVFSVFISFTNLGTGHFLGQDEVYRSLLQEKYVTPDAISLPFKIYPTKKGSIIKAGDLTGLIPKQREVLDIDLHEVLLKKEALTFNELPLSLGKVFERSKQLESFIFILPSGKKLYYHRTNLLLEKTPTYIPKGKNQLYHQKLRLTFSPDPERGFFVSQKSDSNKEEIKLLPGFYTWAGFSNYLKIFESKEIRNTFLKISGWTFLWALISVTLSFSLGMTLALILNEKGFQLKALYRNLLILPYSIPFFISVLVFKGMMNKDFGVINQFLGTIGITAIPWLENALWAKVSCLLVNLWLGFPYMFLITTGILQSIPESVYEAAKIDGASKVQSFKSITFPLILNSVTPLLIGAFAFNLGNFVGIYLLTGGGPAMEGVSTPAGETDILISYTYRLAFEGALGQQFGFASSIALFIFIIIGTLTFVNFKFFNVVEDK